MATKEVRATFDGHSFHVIDPIDLAPNSECLISVKEVKPKQTEDAINDPVSDCRNGAWPKRLVKEHDHYLYGTPKNGES